jgi:L-ascorbate metabolism protein UlaG (beta-lactamase superfamily)
VTFRRLFAAALLAVAAPAIGRTAELPPAAVEVVYLANEGFLITAGETKVLVDALFGDGIDGYPVVPEETRRQLEAAEGPFAGVDLVLATHFHDDHFDPRSVARYLRHSPGARFVSTHQAVERLRRLPDFEDLAGRVEGHWPAEGERAVVDHAGVRLTLLNFHHGRGRRPPVQNLGFLIDIGGLRLLHVGDAEAKLDELEPYSLGGAGVDVFFVPAWYFIYPWLRSLVTEVGAGARIVMHVAEPDAPASSFGPDGRRAKLVERILDEDPQAVVLRPMEARRFAGRRPAGL